MYSNADFKRLEPLLDYVFDKAHQIYPANAEALYNYSVEESYILVNRMKLSRFYLKKLIEKCNPKFDLSANEKKIRSICLTWKIGKLKKTEEITLTPNQAIQLIDFIQGKGSQTNLF